MASGWLISCATPEAISPRLASREESNRRISRPCLPAGACQAARAQRSKAITPAKGGVTAPALAIVVTGGPGKRCRTELAENGRPLAITELRNDFREY